MDSPSPLTVREASVELGCTEDEVRALIREGELRTVACGIRPGRIPHHVFEAYRRRRDYLRREADRSSPTP